jgi:hypothetical protein
VQCPECGSTSSGTLLSRPTLAVRCLLADRLAVTECLVRAHAAARDWHRPANATKVLSLQDTRRHSQARGSRPPPVAHAASGAAGILGFSSLKSPKTLSKSPEFAARCSESYGWRGQREPQPPDDPYAFVGAPKQESQPRAEIAILGPTADVCRPSGLDREQFSMVSPRSLGSAHQTRQY